MVFLLYLWETLKKWTSSEEMRRGETGGAGGPFKLILPFSQVEVGGRKDCEPGSGARVYAEGGWGWIVCACAFLAHLTTSGCQFSGGALQAVLPNRMKEVFGGEIAGRCLGPFSVSISYLSAPFVVNLCKRRQARLVSILGGCIFPLSLFLTSSVTQVHHIFLTFGVLGGIGSSLVRESSNVFLGHYFRRRRQFVEQVVMAGTGVGLTLFSLLFLSLGRHVDWEDGFLIGGALSLITAILPIFYRPVPHPVKRNSNRATHNQESKKFLLPIGGQLCQSLRLFCVPQIKPLLWATAIGSPGLFMPLFLLLEVSREEGLSGGSLLLLQTHLGLGLSLGVILGAILTLKRHSTWTALPRRRAAITALLTGLSILSISTLEGYYAYSLASWAYGIALGAHLYTLKIVGMELTRTKHWERIWGLLQGIMAIPLLASTAVFIFLRKDSFYLAAIALILSSAILGIKIPNSNCSSPDVSSEDNESPIPPPPPPPPHPYQRPKPPSTIVRSLSLNQGLLMREAYHNDSYQPSDFNYSTFNQPNILRSQSLPQRPTYSEPPPKIPTSQRVSTEDTRRSSERFPALPIEPQFFPVLEIPHQQQAPAFTRFLYDSSLFHQHQQPPPPRDMRNCEYSTNSLTFADSRRRAAENFGQRRARESYY